MSTVQLARHRACGYRSYSTCTYHQLYSLMDWITSGTWDCGIPEKARLESAMNAVVGPDILDVGTRDGTFALTLAQLHPEFNVTGFDTDASSIAWANQKADELGLTNVTFYELDIFDPKTKAVLGEHTYDTVLIMETLEHLPPNRVQEANDIAESLVKKGGRIIFTVPANSHVSDPDHRTTFHREFIMGPDKVWLDGCPHLWIGWYSDL